MIRAVEISLPVGGEFETLRQIKIPRCSVGGLEVIRVYVETSSEEDIGIYLNGIGFKANECVVEVEQTQRYILKLSERRLVTQVGQISAESSSGWSVSRPSAETASPATSSPSFSRIRIIPAA